MHVSKGTTTGIVFAKLIIKAITVLEKAGVHIHNVITDGAKPNRNFGPKWECQEKLIM